MRSQHSTIVPALLLVLSTLTPALAGPLPAAYAGPMSDKQDGWHPLSNTTDSFSPYASPIPNNSNATAHGEMAYTNTLTGKELLGLVLTFVVLFLLVAGIGAWCCLRQYWRRRAAARGGDSRADVPAREGWEKMREGREGSVPKICVEGPGASASMGSVGSSTMDVLEQRGFANARTAQVHQV
uniref:Transmembrane protein n=1 Tax=Tremella fuciformis TaxID=64657 RepID=D5KXZ5_9TREE|nr:unknown [Tremella fuciformis]